MTPYAAMTANAAETVCQSCAATITSPPRERISAMPSGTETASVTMVITTLASPNDSHFATRTRVRRGSLRYVDDAVP
jgi:hypothetical protein